jgi:hypothetical protein
MNKMAIDFRINVGAAALLIGALIVIAILAITPPAKKDE